MRNKFITILLAFYSIPLYVRPFSVVLDAGHGGHDSGAIGTYSKEKNINLNVTLKVGELIQKNCPEVKVIYTRKSDVFVDLHERAAIANRAKADLFISIHTNALPKGRQSVGAETYSLGMARSKDNLDVAKRENSVILYENDYQKRYAGFNPKSSESYIIFEFMQDQFMKQSAQLAKAIQNQYAIVGRVDKGVKQAGFLVLRETSMPSVLTELGFISTPSEEQYLNSAKGTDELARSIYLGFVDYVKSYTRSKSVILHNADIQKAKLDEEQQNMSKADVNRVESAAPEEPISIKNIPTDSLRSTKESASEIITNETTTDKDISQNIKNESITLKVQILVSSKMLRKDSEQFKGIDGSLISYYKENNLYKYTYGNTSSYKEIITLKKMLADKFPGNFVIAMKGDEKISVQQALAELKN